jgi:hypothetical protein
MHAPASASASGEILASFFLAALFPFFFLLSALPDRVPCVCHVLTRLTSPSASGTARGETLLPAAGRPAYSLLLSPSMLDLLVIYQLAMKSEQT